ncbi:MAG: flagellar filament capping protein FliD [Spirochaetia bacterium]
MSDISIPGVSSRYNTEELIEKTMEAERKPLDRMEDRKEEYAQQKKAWSTVNKRLSDVAENANLLYGHENPFQNYIANSSDENILSASADRTASEGAESIKVLQTAKRDAFQSKSLPEDYQVPQGEYGFSLGDQEISFSFKGGDLEDFAEAVRDRGKGLVTAKTVRNTPNTKVIVFEGGETGKENTLSFLKDSTAFGTDSGILEENTAKERTLSPSEENVAALNDSTSSSFTVSEGEVEVEPQGAAEISVSPDLDLGDKLQLRINVQIENIPKEEYTPPSPPPGPSIPSSGGVELEGIEIQNEKSRVAELPEIEEPEPPEEVDTLSVLSINGNQSLQELQDTEEPQTITLDGSDIGDTVSSIVIDNSNTHRKIRVGEIEVLDPDARGDYSPKNPSSKAADARLEIDGVTVERPTNEIDDLIPGVTINPKRASNREVDLQIEPDKEEIKDTLLNFIGSYNRALTEINILTSRQESVVEEISYFEEDEQEEAMEKLGLFQGESTFTQLKSRLQRIASAPYETSAGDELSMLSQMGISTNAGGSGSVSRSRLRGYLELDESQLDSVLENRLSAVQELFGKDTNGDRAIDSGIAYEMNNFLRSYTQRGGLISNRIAGIENRIENTEDDMSDFRDRLERKEQDLKREYGRMEDSLGQLENEREAIEGFDSQNNQ